jgi:urease accessory protein
MGTDAAALLAAWLSPAYPVGGFAYSHGLEWAVQSGAVHDAASCEAWLRTVVGQGAGRSDAILLAHAMLDPDDPELAALALALQPSAERRLESRAAGAAFAQVTAAAYPAAGLDGRPEPLPLALGRAAAAHGLPVALVVRLAVQAFAANLVSAAVRLVPLGQTDGQRVLARLMPLCREVAAEAETAPLAAIGGCVLLSDVASMCHETQHTRLFRS